MKKNTEGQQATAEELLKAIDNYLDGELQEEVEDKVLKAKVEEEEKELEEEEEKEEDEEGKAKKKSMPKAKKSLTDEELEEYQVLKKAKIEEEEKKQKEEKDSIMKSFTTLVDTVSKLSEKVDQLSKQPVATPKSVDGLKIIEKANTGTGNDGNDLMKSLKEKIPAPLFKAKIAHIMFEKGVKANILQPEHVSEYEVTGTLKDPQARSLVKGLIETEIKNGTF